MILHLANYKIKYFHFMWMVASLCVTSCSSTQSIGGKTERVLISHIESNIIPISKSGIDSGVTQSIVSRMAQLEVRGLSIAVFDQGIIIGARGYELSDKNLSIKVDTATIFQAASMSKPVTSVGIFTLIEKKLLSLDEDINLKLHTWKLPNNDFTVKEKVTVRRILNHTAGLSVSGFNGYNPNDAVPTLPQILNGTPPANSKPVRVIVQPGTREDYSGGGYTILQLLLEDVTDESFPKYMNENVLQHIGLAQSIFSLNLPDNMAIHASKAYQQNGELVDGGYHIYPEQAAAGLWITPSDYARFMLNIGNSYRGNLTAGILEQSSVQNIFTTAPNAGGLGFGVDGEGEAFRFRHSGGNAGFVCYAISFAKIGRGVVVMSNSHNGYQLIHEVVRAIAREYKWPPMWPGE